jgi:hypothetical protein
LIASQQLGISGVQLGENEHLVNGCASLRAQSLFKARRIHNFLRNNVIYLFIKKGASCCRHNAPFDPFTFGLTKKGEI